MTAGHLIHIGYPKTGSTFLQHWFRAHPQLAYVEGGLAGYHDVHELVRDAMKAIQFLYYVTSRENLSIPWEHEGRAEKHAGPRNSAATEENESRACDILASLFPNAFILVMTRGFRAMAYSSYSQYVRIGGSQRLDQLIQDASAEAPWHYDRLINKYREAFGGRVIVLPFEMLRDSPAALLATLEARLGLEPLVFSPARVNEALSPVELAWYPRLAAVADNISPWFSKAFRRMSFDNRLGGLVRALQSVHPLAPVEASMITDDLLAPFRGRAELLRTIPEYAPYAAEYLI